MLKLTLNRYDCNDKATLGTLDCQLDGQPDTNFRCYTLEDRDRQLEVFPDAKVFGETCIPRGTYDVVFRWSPHFQKKLPRLLNVPGFEGVLIHTGNKPEDTEGCILVGARPTGAAWIPNSKATFAVIFARIEEALVAGEKVQITIS